MSFISFREQYGASSSGQNGSSGSTSAPRSRGPTSSSPPGFGMIRAPSTPASTSSSRKSSTTPSATVTSQGSTNTNTSVACGRRMFAAPPPLLSPIRDGPTAGYYVPFTLNDPHSKSTLSSSTKSSTWRFSVPILHLQPTPHQRQQQSPLNLDNDDTRNQSSPVSTDITGNYM